MCLMKKGLNTLLIAVIQVLTISLIVHISVVRRQFEARYEELTARACNTVRRTYSEKHTASIFVLHGP